MQPSNWDRPRFGQRDWGRDRFDMSFQNQGEDNKRQQSPFGMFGPRRTTESPSIVGQIPGQIGRNRGFGQRDDSENDKQPRPPSLPPMPQEPNTPEQDPGRDLGGTESNEVPMSTQPSLDRGPTQVGQRERMGPGQIGRPREIETTPLPQQPITQYPDDNEENYYGFGENEPSPVPPPPVVRNPNQVGQRRPAIPGRRPGQGDTSPWSQPGIGEEGQTASKQLTTPGRFGNSEDERKISSPGKTAVEQGRGQSGRGREIGQRRNIRPGWPGMKGRPSSKNDDELQSNEELEEFGVSKQRQIPTPPQHSINQGQNQIGQRRDNGFGSQQTPGYQDLGQRGYNQGAGQRRGMSPGESGVAEPPFNQEDEMESNEGMGKVVGALKPRGFSTPPQPSVVQVENQIGQRRGTGSGRDRSPAQHDPRQYTVGQNPIHPAAPRQSMEAGRQTGGSRYSGGTEVTQTPPGQVPRQFGQRRGTERRVPTGRNVPGSQQYPSEQDPSKVGDAEVITSPTFFIRNRGDSDGSDRPTPPRPTMNRRPGKGSGEQGDLEGVETRGVSRPPRG